MTNGVIQPDDGRNIFETISPEREATQAEIERLIEDRVKELVAKEMRAERASMITVFGIFAALIIFASLEVQILQKVGSDVYLLTGLSLVMLASFLAFVVALDFIGRGWRDRGEEQWTRFPWLLVALIGLIFWGAVQFFELSRTQQESNTGETTPITEEHQLDAPATNEGLE